MSILVYPPPKCPMCDTEQLFARRWSVLGRAIVRYWCPKCHWRVEGGDPDSDTTQPPASVRARGSSPVVPPAELELAPFPIKTVDELPQALDQPAYRLRMTDNGADPLNRMGK